MRKVATALWLLLFLSPAASAATIHVPADFPTIQQALNAASPSSLTYAYALYDYGHALLLAGDPKDAVKVLYQRLQIPNQTEAVRQELQLALVALGQKSQSGGAGSGPPGHSHVHGGSGVGTPGRSGGSGAGLGPGSPPGQSGSPPGQGGNSQNG